MSNPLEQYLIPQKKKKSNNPLEAYLSPDESEEIEAPTGSIDPLGLVRGSLSGREGVLGKASDFGRGVLQTAVTGLPGLAEIGTGLVQKLPAFGPEGMARKESAKRTQEWLKKYREGWTEEIDPQGLAGGAGQIAGLFAPGGPGTAYSQIYGKTGQALAKASPKMATLLEKAAEKSVGTLAEKTVSVVKKAPARMLASAIKGTPFNVAAGVSLDEEDAEFQNKTIAFGIIADLVTGGIDRGTVARPKRAGVEELTKPIDPKDSTLPVERLTDLIEMKKKGEAAAAIKDERMKAQRVAKAEWEVANQDGVWKDLPVEEKRRIVDEWKLRNKHADQAEGAPADPTTELIADATTPEVEAVIAATLKENPEATVEEIQAKVAELPEVKAAVEATIPKITDHEQVNTGGEETQHIITLDTIEGPVRVIAYVGQDGKTGRVDWLGHTEKPEIDLGITQTRGVIRVLQETFPGVAIAKYVRNDRQKEKVVGSDPSMDTSIRVFTGTRHEGPLSVESPVANDARHLGPALYTTSDEGVASAYSIINERDRPKGKANVREAVINPKNVFDYDAVASDEFKLKVHELYPNADIDETTRINGEVYQAVAKATGVEMSGLTREYPGNAATNKMLRDLGFDAIKRERVERHSYTGLRPKPHTEYAILDEIVFKEVSRKDITSVPEDALEAEFKRGVLEREPADDADPETAYDAVSDFVKEFSAKHDIDFYELIDEATTILGNGAPGSGRKPVFDNSLSDDAAIQAHADAGFNEAMDAQDASRVPLTDEQQAAVLAQREQLAIEARLTQLIEADVFKDEPEFEAFTKQLKDIQEQVPKEEQAAEIDDLFRFFETPPEIQPTRTMLESTAGKAAIEDMTLFKLDAVEQTLLDIASDPNKPKAQRERAERDLATIADWRRRNQPEYIAPPPSPLPEGVSPAAGVGSSAYGAEVLPAMDVPERVAPQGTRVAASGETYLTTTDLPKPLEQMTKDAREKILDRLIVKRDALPDTAREQFDELQNDIDTIQSLGDGTGRSGAAAESNALQREAASVREALGDPEDITPEEVQRLSKLSPRKASDEDLRRFVQWLAYNIDGNPDPDAVKDLTKRMHKVMQEQADRFNSGGLTVKIPPTLGGGAVGFIGGYIFPTEEEADRMNNAWMGAMVGFGGGLAAQRYLKRVRGQVDKPRTAADYPAGIFQEEIAKTVISGYEKESPKLSFRQRARQVFWASMYRTGPMEHLAKAIGADKLGTARNFAKLYSMYGRHEQQTVATIRYGPSVMDEFGNMKKLDAIGLEQIADMAEGDYESVGQLAAARHSLEQGGGQKVPFNVITAEGVYLHMPESIHKAADELRKYDLANIDGLVYDGIVSQDGRDIMAKDKYFAHLSRIFNWDIKTSTINIDANKSLVVGVSNPVQKKKHGGDMPIRNPFEVSLETTPQYLRARELNRMKTTMIDAWEAAGKPDVQIKERMKDDSPSSPEHEAYVKALRTEMGLSEIDANSVAAGFDPKSIEVLDDNRGLMRVMREGVLKTYEIPANTAQAFLALNATEMHMFVKALGLPARTASKGVTLHPMFVTVMAFLDGFQAFQNTQYKFRPGWDQAKGWWAAMAETPRFQQMVDAGLPMQSIGQSYDARTSSTLEALRQHRGRPLDITIRHLKELRPIEAYKAMLQPIANAARIGEGLRALDHGASDIDAVYAAMNVTGNYNEQGLWAGMRGLQHTTMFLGPALQVMNTAAYRGGVHPFRASGEGKLADRGKDFLRYTTKAFVGIAVPSYLFWLKAELDDDEDIRQMRQTEFGRRFWFLRMPWGGEEGEKGNVIKIRKPILDGQLFGTAMEMYLDKEKNDNPEAIKDWAKGILKDASFNLMPSALMIPLSLQANQNLQTGWNIEPERDQNLATEMKGKESASWLARELSAQIAPKAEGINLTILQRALSPAGMDYLFGTIGGMLGKDAVAAVSQIMEQRVTGYIPAAREWVVVRSAITGGAPKQTKNLQRFYEQAEKTEKVSSMINYLMQEDPEAALGYMELHQAEYQAAAVFAQNRRLIAGYRRSINDLREMPGVTSVERRQLTSEYLRRMDETAALANEILAGIR